MWATSAVLGVISPAAIVAYRDWEQWADFLLGLSLIVSPWLWGFAHTRAMHFSIGIGLVVVFLAALDLFLHYDATHLERSHQDRVGPSAPSQPH